MRKYRRGREKENITLRIPKNLCETSFKFNNGEGLRGGKNSESFLRNNKEMIIFKSQNINNTVLLRSPEDSLLPSIRDNNQKIFKTITAKYYINQKEKLIGYKERTAMASFKDQMDNIQLEIDLSYEQRLKNESEGERNMFKTFKTAIEQYKL